MSSHTPQPTSHRLAIVAAVLFSIFTMTTSTAIISYAAFFAEDEAEQSRAERRLERSRDRETRPDRNRNESDRDVDGIEYIRSTDVDKYASIIQNATTLSTLESEINEALEDQLSEHHEGPLGYDAIDFVLTEPSFDEFVEQHEDEGGALGTYGDSYDPADESQLNDIKDQMMTFFEQYSRYPLEFAPKFVDTVVYGSVEGNNGYEIEYAGAIGDVLTFDIESMGSLDVSEQIDIINHEMMHTLDAHFALEAAKSTTKSYVYLDDVLNDTVYVEWIKSNVKGLDAYDEKTSQDRSGEWDQVHPEPGFVTGYARVSVAEDRAEIFSYLMSATKRSTLERLINKDPTIKKKVQFLTQELETLGIDDPDDDLFSREAA